MKIIFAAQEDAWGGVLHLLRNAFPQHEFAASGRFGFDTLKGFDILIPTMAAVRREHLAEADSLKLIHQCGAGLENVDLQAAKELGIKVANVPTDISGNADSVAELGIYLMVGLARRFREMAQSMASRQMGTPKGRAVKGKTVGIIGLGGIGRALIKRLKAFDVRLIGIKQSEPEKAAAELGLEWAGTPDKLEELLGRSDFVILCLPATDRSRNMIDRKAFAAMKRQPFLINLARGGLVDREALLEALSSGQIAGAGLDVFWEEPPDPNDPIFKYNVLTTPHIAGSTDISTDGIVRVMSENFRRLEAGGEILHRRA